MVEELRHIFERAQEQPEDIQRHIAALIEHVLDEAAEHATAPAEEHTDYAGAWSDLPADDEFETLDRLRHAASPTPPIEETLVWLEEH